MHRAHEQSARHGATQGSGVEVLTTAGPDVEGAAGKGGEALVDKGGLAVDQTR
jgi:hypothetical protein